MRIRLVCALLCMVFMAVLTDVPAAGANKKEAAQETEASENSGEVPADTILLSWGSVELTIPGDYVWNEDSMEYMLYDSDGNLLMEIFSRIWDCPLSDAEYAEKLEGMEELLVDPNRESGFDVPYWARLTVAGHPAANIEMRGILENGYPCCMNVFFINNENNGKETVLSFAGNLDHLWPYYYQEIDHILATATDPEDKTSVGYSILEEVMPEAQEDARETEDAEAEESKAEEAKSEEAEEEETEEASSPAAKTPVRAADYRKGSFEAAHMRFELPLVFAPSTEDPGDEWNTFFRPADSGSFLQFHEAVFSYDADSFAKDAAALAGKVTDAYGGTLDPMRIPCSLPGIPAMEFSASVITEEDPESPWNMRIRILANPAAGEACALILAESPDDVMDFGDVYLYTAESAVLSNENLPLDETKVTPAFQTKMERIRQTAVRFCEYLSGQETGLNLQVDYNYQKLSGELDAALEELNAVNVNSLSQADRLCYDKTRECVTQAIRYREGALTGGILYDFSDEAGALFGSLTSLFLGEEFGEGVGNAAGRFVEDVTGEMLSGLGNAVNDPNGMDVLEGLFGIFF